MSGWFPDGTNTAIEKVMMVYRRPNGMLVRDYDKDGFGRTCLLGLWGLHTERSPHIRCSHDSADGKSKVLGVNVCPICQFWNTNDVTLNNHSAKALQHGAVLPRRMGSSVAVLGKDAQPPEEEARRQACVLARTSKLPSRLPRRRHIKESLRGSIFKCRKLLELQRSTQFVGEHFGRSVPCPRH